jgi:hypothetical protein
VMTLIYFFVIQRTGDCDFFAWANNEMTTYETKIMERLKALDDRRKVDSDRLERSLLKQKIIINMLSLRS